MARYSLLDPEETLEDDDTPYSALTRSGESPELDVEPIEEAPADPVVVPSPSPTPPPSVRDVIASRMAGSSDPLIKDFERNQEDAQRLRAATIQANGMANFAQGIGQIAQGVNAPKQNTGLYDNMRQQNASILADASKDQDRRARVLQAIEQRQSREQLAKDNRLARQTLLQGKKMDVESTKAEAQNVKWATQMKDDLDPNKARAGNMAGNQKRVDNAERIETLLAQVHSNPDPRQMEELAISTQALLSSSGSPAMQQVQALIPKTAVGDVNKFKEWLTNDPTGTGQQKFVQRLAETVVREKEVAQGQVHKAQRQRLAVYGKFKKADPETYNALLRSYGLDETEKKITLDVEKSAGASVKSKPKTIIQNGHTYTLNESTGAYE